MNCRKILEEYMTLVKYRGGDAQKDSFKVLSGEVGWKVFPSAVVVPQGWIAKGIGGVFDASGKGVKSSSLPRGPKHFLYEARGSYTGKSLNREGSVVFAGFYDNHFGHFIVEVVSRLWILMSRINVRRIVFALPSGVERKRDDLLSYFLRYSGIDVEFVDEPTRYDEIIVPDVGISLRNQFHYEQWEWMRSVGYDKVLEEHNNTTQPLYLSRSKLEKGRRKAYGERELEEALSSCGVKVVHLQDIPFQEQIRLLTRHDTIIGFEGSQLHNILFTAGEKKMIQLDRRPVNSTYRMIDEMLSNQSHYVSAMLPSEYRGFTFKGDVSESFIFDVNDVAEQISEILNISVPEVSISAQTRSDFGTEWLTSASRSWILWGLGKGKGPFMDSPKFYKNIEIAFSASLGR